MSSKGHVILATGVPVFSDGGDFLLCELKSGQDTWTFGIRWPDTEEAIEQCGIVLDVHRSKARNVMLFPGRPHGH